MNVVLRACPVLVVALVACSNAASSQLASDDERLTDDRPSTACACALDQVCDVGSGPTGRAARGKCIARPEQNASEVFASVELLDQVSPLDHSIMGRLGEAAASFNAGDPLPEDTRPKFTTDGGESCSFEVGTNYPSSYGNGKFWPSTPGLGAGKITFDVAGARGPIELEPVNAQDGYGWGYLHSSTPPAIQDGNTTFADFFDPAYVPAGRAVTGHLAGGDDLASQAVTGELPRAFSITSPAVEAGTDTSVPSGADLSVTWSPAQPSAYMEIFLTADVGGDIGLVSCRVKDDGAVVIPSAALNVFIGRVGLQLRRTTERYTRIEQRDGKLIHASVLGRHARLGAFTLAPR